LELKRDLPSLSRPPKLLVLRVLSAYIVVAIVTTLSSVCSHSGSVLNFKINCEGGDYFIAPKRRFRSARALRECYRTVPIKSKKAANEKIFLLHPIPVDPALEQMHKKLLEEKGGHG